MHQDALVVLGVSGAHFRVLLELEFFHVEEVGHHRNVFVDPKQFVGVVAQAVGHGGHRVALVDGKGDHRLKGRVLAQQGDVGAVQGGDHRQVVAFFHQNLFGRVRRRSVGDGVVHVQQVQSFMAGHVHHFTGEHQLVRRVVKQGVLVDAYLVVEDVFSERTQPHGLVVGDEMHLVSFVCQCLAQLGGHHATPAKGGVANDSDFHASKSRHSTGARPGLHQWPRAWICNRDGIANALAPGG